MRESFRETVIKQLHDMPLRRTRRKARNEVRVKFVKIRFPQEIRQTVLKRVKIHNAGDFGSCVYSKR